MFLISGTFSGRGLYAWAAARNLGDLGDRGEETGDLLAWAAGTDDPILSDWARVSRRKLGLAPAPELAALLGKLESPDEAVRWRAVKDIAALGAGAHPAALALERLLEDESWVVRAAAKAALREIRRDR